MMTLTKLSFIGMMLLLCSSVAEASDKGFYVGADGFIGDIESSWLGTGVGINFGYNTSQNFGIDAAIEKYNAPDNEWFDGTSGTVYFSYLAAKPMLNFGKFNAFVEIGAAYVNFTQYTHTEQTIPNTEFRPFGGLGVGYNFTPNVELAFSVNKIQDSSTPLTFAMLALTYHMV